MLKSLATGVVIYRGSVNDYVVDCIRSLCTCPGYVFRGACKHLREVCFMPVEFERVESQIKEYSSFLSGLNALYGGRFLTSDALIGFHGLPHVGKTLILLHEAYNLASQGVNVLYVDTEGNVGEMIKAWRERLTQRFKPKGKLYLESRRSLESLCEYLGFKVSVSFKSSDKKGEKGKMEFRVIESVQEPEVDRFVQRNSIGAVFIDSLASPIRQSFPDEQQNFPARASALSLVFGRLVGLQERYGVVVIVVMHTSMNPANPYETVGEMRGGIVTHHYVKRAVYVDMRASKELKNYRRLWIFRAEDRAKLGGVVGVKISDYGVEEVDDWASLLTDSELKLVSA